MQWYVRGLNYTLYIRWKFQKFKWSCPWSWMTHDAKHDKHLGSVLGTILWYKEFDWILYAEHHLQVCNFSLQWFPRFGLNEADLKGWIISFCIAPTVCFFFLFSIRVWISDCSPSKFCCPETEHISKRGAEGARDSKSGIHIGLTWAFVREQLGSLVHFNLLKWFQ